MRPRPIHDFGKLIPKIYLLEVQMLNRCSGDDQPVVVLMLYFGEFPVKHVQMFNRRVLGAMR